MKSWLFGKQNANNKHIGCAFETFFDKIGITEAFEKTLLPSRPPHTSL